MKIKSTSEFNKDILTIAVFTFLTVAVWIAADVYHAVVTSQITEVEQTLIAELNPKIDPKVLSEIKSRVP